MKSLQILWILNGWVILIWLLGFLNLKQHPSGRKGICDAIPGFEDSWVCTLCSAFHNDEILPTPCPEIKNISML